jgi:oligopeptide transport system ATP-binding protein
MYGGRVMEHCKADDLFAKPSHPYTIGLLRALPRLDREGEALLGIPGNPPNMARPPVGCPFHERCLEADAHCASATPRLEAFSDDPTWLRACYRPVTQLKLQGEASHV